MVILSNRWLQSSMIDLNWNIPEVSQLTSYLASVSNQQLASIFFTSKATGAYMHTFLFKKCSKDLKKQNSISLMYLVLFNNSLWINVAFFF